MISKVPLGPAGSQVYRFGRQHKFFGRQKIFGPSGQRFLLENFISHCQTTPSLIASPIGLFAYHFNLPRFLQLEGKRNIKTRKKKTLNCMVSLFFISLQKIFIAGTKCSLRRFGCSLMCGDSALQFHACACL